MNICKICSKTFRNNSGLTSHILKKHKIKIKEYYVLYLNNKNEGKCQECNSNTKFISVERGFRKYCSSKCSAVSIKTKEKRKNMVMNKYNVENISQLEEIKNKKKEKSIKNFGKENPFQSDEIKEKIRQTCLDKYGVDNPLKNQNIRRKGKITKLKRYDDENYINLKKAKQTKLERYGNENYVNIEKCKKTKKERYGIENYNNRKKAKITCLKKYGTEHSWQSDEIKKNIKKIKREKYGYECEFNDVDYRKKYNGKTSKIEKIVSEKLNAEHKFVYKNKEFDIKLNNDLIEIDGDFWHPDKLENLTLIQLNGVINDKEKIELTRKSDYNLYKIHTSKLKEYITLNYIKDNSYIPNYSLCYYQKIIKKEYFENYIDKKGKYKLKRYVNLLLKFIRTFQPEFPFPENKEGLNKVLETIQNYDFNQVVTGDTFNNRCYNIGSNYLKSHFKSYWKSRYKSNGQSPVDAWCNDDNIMKRVIEYRIGLNNSGEIFDFSLHQLVRGLSAIRFTISFFKPLLAAAIYKHFLGDVDKPTVIDPCAGFGGRMLGFKAAYPNGTYIGIEPNPETYNELVKLSKNFSNIKLYNCRLEDYSANKSCDLTFTSVPYFNSEIYSDNKEMSFDEWSGMMNCLINSYKNVLINLSEKVYDIIKFNYKEKYYIKNNTSHFDKNSNMKKELLLKL